MAGQPFPSLEWAPGELGSVLQVFTECGARELSSSLWNVDWVEMVVRSDCELPSRNLFLFSVHKIFIFGQVWWCTP